MMSIADISLMPPLSASPSDLHSKQKIEENEAHQQIYLAKNRYSFCTSTGSSSHSSHALYTSHGIRPNERSKPYDLKCSSRKADFKGRQDKLFDVLADTMSPNSNSFSPEKKRCDSDPIYPRPYAPILSKSFTGQPSFRSDDNLEPMSIWMEKLVVHRHRSLPKPQNSEEYSVNHPSDQTWPFPATTPPISPPPDEPIILSRPVNEVIPEFKDLHRHLKTIFRKRGALGTQDKKGNPFSPDIHKAPVSLIQVFSRSLSNISSLVSFPDTDEDSLSDDSVNSSSSPIPNNITHNTYQDPSIEEDMPSVALIAQELYDFQTRRQIISTPPKPPSTTPNGRRQFRSPKPNDSEDTCIPSSFVSILHKLIDGQTTHRIPRSPLIATECKTVSYSDLFLQQRSHVHPLKFNSQVKRGGRDDKATDFKNFSPFSSSSLAFSNKHIKKLFCTNENLSSVSTKVGGSNTDSYRDNKLRNALSSFSTNYGDREKKRNTSFLQKLRGIVKDGYPRGGTTKVMYDDVYQMLQFQKCNENANASSIPSSKRKSYFGVQCPYVSIEDNKSNISQLRHSFNSGKDSNSEERNDKQQLLSEENSQCDRQNSSPLNTNYYNSPIINNGAICNTTSPFLQELSSSSKDCSRHRKNKAIVSLLDGEVDDEDEDTNLSLCQNLDQKFRCTAEVKSKGLQSCPSWPPRETPIIKQNNSDPWKTTSLKITQQKNKEKSQNIQERIAVESQALMKSQLNNKLNECDTECHFDNLLPVESEILKRSEICSCGHVIENCFSESHNPEGNNFVPSTTLEDDIFKYGVSSTPQISNKIIKNQLNNGHKHVVACTIDRSNNETNEYELDQNVMDMTMKDTMEDNTILPSSSVSVQQNNDLSENFSNKSLHSVIDERGDDNSMGFSAESSTSLMSDKSLEEDEEKYLRNFMYSSNKKLDPDDLGITKYDLRHYRVQFERKKQVQPMNDPTFCLADASALRLHTHPGSCRSIVSDQIQCESFLSTACVDYSCGTDALDLFHILNYNGVSNLCNIHARPELPWYDYAIAHQHQFNDTESSPFKLDSNTMKFRAPKLRRKSKYRFDRPQVAADEIQFGEKQVSELKQSLGLLRQNDSLKSNESCKKISALESKPDESKHLAVEDIFAMTLI